MVLPLPSSRLWLKLHGGLVVACAIVTLALGLRIWFLTLQTRSNLGLLWARQSRENQSILQQKVPTSLKLFFLYLLGHDFCTNGILQFRCCGYFDNKSFQQDRACSSPAAASRIQACMGPFTTFANHFFDLVFTSMFGFVSTYNVFLLGLSQV